MNKNYLHNIAAMLDEHDISPYADITVTSCEGKPSTVVVVERCTYRIFVENENLTKLELVKEIEL